MNLYSLLQSSADAGKPVRVGLIGAGKFGSMFLSQVPTTKGMVVTAIADLDVTCARSACATVGWDDARVAAMWFTEDAAELITRADVDVAIDAADPTVQLRREMEAAFVN